MVAVRMVSSASRGASVGVSESVGAVVRPHDMSIRAT
jgi:hypothetical protein